MSQNITLENIWMAGSKIVFIGVENRLILKGKFEGITSIQPDKANIERIGDTLILKATQAGMLQIILQSTDQPLSFEFNAIYLPKPIVVITDDSLERKDVTKEAILKAKNINLRSGNAVVKLYEDYLITESILSINNRSYPSIGNTLSKEAKQAIMDLKSGSIIKVELVKARSKSTGKGMTVGGNQSFTIL